MNRWLMLLLMLFLLSACTESQVVRHQGKVLWVTQTETKIIAKNVQDYPVAIRISWDGRDPYGTGKGRDSYIDNWVTSKERVSRNFSDHTSVQIWAWNSSGILVDSCGFAIRPESKID